MDVIEWLLEGDPAIRWQVMRDLIDAPAQEVATERARVASDGWGRRLLDLQEPDGKWGGGFYSPKWVSTTYTLLLLRHLGVDAGSVESIAARDRLMEKGGTWRHGVDGGGGVPFFEYLGETCVTAMNLKLACYFEAASSRTTEVVAWLLGQQLEDGGWNCEALRGSVRSSFHTTISVLEGLLQLERSGSEPPMHASTRSARNRGYEYLLDRRLMRRASTGEIVNPAWTRFSFPPRWWFDVLRGLDHLRDAGVAPDERWDEALNLVDRKRTRDGRWKLQNHHGGREHFRMESPGEPSRWNTLRAMRVLRHAGRE